MSKEAMKLALEALVRSRKAVSGDLDLAGCAYGKNDSDGHRYADAKTALVTLDKAITALREALAQQALDKKAENARALGLDYEPSAGTQVSKVWWDGEKLMAKQVLLGDFYKPAQQEPVAWMDGYRNIYSLEEKAAGCPEATIALVPMANHKKTSGSPIKELNCICGAVWEGDELVHLPRQPAQRTWVNLTPQNLNEIFKVANTGEGAVHLALKLIKEKNT